MFKLDHIKYQGINGQTAMSMNFLHKILENIKNTNKNYEKSHSRSKSKVKICKSENVA